MAAGAIYAVCGLLLYACWTDVTRLTIPNWIPLAIVLMFVARSVITGGAALFGHLVAAGVVFAIGIALFAWRQLGGGDVKLMSAVALWIGPSPELGRAFLVMSVAGAAVSLLVLLARKTMARALIRRIGCCPAVLEPSAGAPYALAIAAGFFAVTLVP